MKWFISSDIHSYFDEWVTALNNAGFNINDNNHGILVLGDLCDRGPKPVECIKFVLDLYNKNRAIIIRGNHEDLMEEAICRTYFESHDYHNCTVETAQILTGLNINDNSDYEILTAMKGNKLWNEYINATVDYYELGDNIFVHGWIPVKYEPDDGYDYISELYRPSHPVYNPDWRTVVWQEDWKDARWFNGMKMWKYGIIEPNKTIWCGHYHTSYGHANYENDGKEFLGRIETYYIDPDTGKEEPHVNNDPFIANGIIAMDACTALSGKVNCLVLEV